MQKCLWTLSKAGLVARLPNAKYEGFRLTYGGADHLALHAHSKSGVVYSVGNRIGTGKESDIVAVAPPSGGKAGLKGKEEQAVGGGKDGELRNMRGTPAGKDIQYALKVHRLGRISFRRIKEKRDYLGKRHSSSWMHLSRLAALKEWAFMNCLYDHGFPVPKPIAHNRHTIVMGLVDGFPLRQVAEVPDPAGLYGELMELVLRLAQYGLIHGDFNEFNILIREDDEEGGLEESGKQAGAKMLEDGQAEVNSASIKLTPILIDFPQMVSMSHPDAKSYFERDVDCIKRYFSRRFGFTSDERGPFFEDALKTVGNGGAKLLDVEAYASGFSKKMAKELEIYLREVGGDNGPLSEAIDVGNDDLESRPDDITDDELG